jgi:hypothetical protein
MHGAQLCAESTVYTGKASMREQGRIGAAANALRAAAGRAGVWPAGRRLPSQPRQQPCTHPSAGRRRKRGLPRCSPGTGRTRAFRFKMHAWNRGTERGKVEIDAIFLRSTRAVMPPKSGSRTLRCTSKKIARREKGGGATEGGSASSSCCSRRPAWMGRGRQASSGWHGMAARTRRVIREMLLLLPPPARELLRCAARRDGTGRRGAGTVPCRRRSAAVVACRAAARAAHRTAPDARVRRRRRVEGPGQHAGRGQGAPGARPRAVSLSHARTTRESEREAAARSWAFRARYGWCLPKGRGQ